MSETFDFFFAQYKTYSTTETALEVIAVVFGFLSVWCSKKKNKMINGYYFVMSVYGWYLWTRKVDNIPVTKISRTTIKEKKISLFIFIATLLFVYIVYTAFNKWTNWVAYVDTITTAIFFVGMWLMAKRKIENWLFWIVGDIISIPLYFYKGFTFTSFQYLGFTFIAIFGYYAWKKNLNKTQST
jgi:nicotinamide mononucleotide transporter